MATGTIVWKDSAQSLCVWDGLAGPVKFCPGLKATWKKNHSDFMKSYYTLGGPQSLKKAERRLDDPKGAKYIKWSAQED